MKPVRFSALSGLLALSLLGSANAQTAPAPVPTPAPAAKSIPADPALWVVKDKDTTIYLFGTIHVLKPNLSWFDSAVRKAFDASGQLVLEIPMPTEADAQKVILPLALDKTGKPLTEKLSPADRPVYTAAMAKIGVPAAALEQLEPWFAGLTIGQIALQKAGYSPDEGAEKALDAAAKAAGKPVTGLETLEQQLGYFDTLPESDQIAFLMAAAKDIDTVSTDIDAMVDRWKAGDAKGLSDLMNKELNVQPNLYKVLLVNRNVRWAEWIDKRMQQPGTVFIAVGAGHLAGKDSVQAQLAKHKLIAQQIKY